MHESHPQVAELAATTVIHRAPGRERASWALYDFANTIFSMNVATLYFSVWLIKDLGASSTLYALGNGISSFLVVLSVPLVVAIIFFGSFLLQLFGAGFSVAYPVVVILAIGCLINALWGSLWGDLLTLTGYYKEATVIIVLVTALNLALTAVLTPRFGISGAAAATTTAVVVRSALMAIFVRRKFGFWPWTVWRRAVRS